MTEERENKDGVAVLGREEIIGNGVHKIQDQFEHLP